MSSTAIQVTADPDLVNVEVRNLVTVGARVGDMLDLSPLRFRLDLPIRTTPAARSGANKLLPALESRIEGVVPGAIEAARKTVDKELAALAEALRKLLAGGAGQADDGHEQAMRLVKPAAFAIEHAVDGLPVAVRESLGKLLKASDAQGWFPKQKLCSVGSWGFQRSEGIRLRAGLFKPAPASSGDGDRLWRDLSSARSHTRRFVLVPGPGSSVGLAVGASVGAGDLARARQMAQGSGTPLYGEVAAAGGAFHFKLDKTGSQGTREKLARRVREQVRTLCRKNVAIRFDDDDADGEPGAD